MERVYVVQVEVDDEVRDDLTVASSAERARALAEQKGLNIIDVTFNLNATFSLMTAGELDEREMAQFYSTLGGRLDAGMEITRAVRDASDFTRNVAVKVTLSTLADAVERGQTLENAMREAGLPERDYSLVRAVNGEAGQLPQGLKNLGIDYNRRSVLKTKIKGLIYEPVIFLSLIYVLAYFGITRLAPRIEGFFEKLTTIETPVLAQKVYWFTGIFNSNIQIATILYIAFGIGVFLLCRSKYMMMALDRIPIVKALSERADHAGLWSVFSMLYDAATRWEEIAILTASTASRQDNYESFQYMAEKLARGETVTRAVKDAGFPPWVRSSVANAFSSGGSDQVVKTLKMFTDNLQADVEMLTTRLSTVVTFFVTIIMGLGVLALAFITVVPMIQSALNAA